MSTEISECTLWKNNKYSIVVEDVYSGDVHSTFYRLYVKLGKTKSTYVDLRDNVGEAIEDILMELREARNELAVLSKYIKKES